MQAPIFDTDDFILETFFDNSTTAEKVGFYRSLGLKPHSRWLIELENERTTAEAAALKSLYH
jgi:hypothetical protein